MGNALLPNIMRSGKVLTPQLANETFTRLLEQIKQAAARRYIFDEIIIPFKAGATQATAAEQLQAYTNATRPYTVIGRELYVYADADETFRAAVDNMDDITVVGAGAATIAIARDLPTQRQAAGYVNVAFTGDATTWTLTAGWLVLHVAYDRFEGDLSLAGISRLLGSETMLAARTKVNDNITNLDTAITDLEAAERQQRVDLIMFGDTDFTTIPAVARDMPVPVDGGTLARVELEITADVGRSVTLDLLDDGLAVVGTVTVAGTGSGNLVGNNFDPAALLPDNDCDPTRDYFLRWSLSGAGTVYTAYAMLCWS